MKYFTIKRLNKINVIHKSDLTSGRSTIYTHNTYTCFLEAFRGQCSLTFSFPPICYRKRGNLRRPKVTIFIVNLWCLCFKFFVFIVDNNCVDITLKRTIGTYWIIWSILETIMSSVLWCKLRKSSIVNIDIKDFGRNPAFLLIQLLLSIYHNIIKTLMLFDKMQMIHLE